MPDNSATRSLYTFVMRYLSEDRQVDSLCEMVRATQVGGRVDIIDFERVLHEQEVASFNPQRLKRSF